jgi:hypothetical protein
VAGCGLETLRQFAMALPEAVQAPHFHLTSFRINKRIFAQETAAPDGNGREGAAYAIINVPQHRREILIEVQPDTFTLAVWGSWRGLRVRLDAIEPADLADLVADAWAHLAPKRLLPRP